MKKIIKRNVNESQFVSNIIHPVLHKIFSSRGIQSDDEIDHSLNQLLPYHQLTDINKAVSLLIEAIQKQQRIVIVGDFDADGATSTAIAVSALNSFGAQHVDYLVPNRFEYGYGLTPEIVEVAHRAKPDLIITVDNGISSIAGVTTAKQLGIKVLVTDHHLPGNELPDANAIVNPNQHGDEFPSKHLAGCGVIFYVMSALRNGLRDINWFAEQNIDEPNMSRLLDLVALGTIADVVVLDKNNRVLVEQGMRRIRAGKCRPGIKALLTIAKRNAINLVASDLSFGVAPRLNAAGRLDDMSEGIACLLETDLNQALKKAKMLDELNHERRNIEADMKQQAMKALNHLHISEQGLPMGLCIYDETWHQGVIGILAGRIKEKFHRPTIAFAKVSETEIKGSARSIPILHIRDALDAIAAKHPELVSKFGGHAMAAGLSINLKDLEAFKKAFESEVARQLTDKDLQAEILSDGELNQQDFNLTLAELLRTAAPWGQGFPEPMFDGVFKLVNQRIVGTNHLKMTLDIGEQNFIDAIAFNIDVEQWPNHRCEHVHIAYRLDVNEFQGIRRLQLIVEDLEAVTVFETA